METFEIVAKKNKKRNIKRIILWSTTVVVVFFGIYIVARMITGKLISDQAWKVVNEVQLVESVAFPNIETYTWSANGGDMFHGGIKGRQAKDIYGIPLDYGEYKTDFGIFNINRGTLFHANSGRYTESGSTIQIENNQKVPQFYNKKAKEEKGEPVHEPTQELPYIKEMKNQLVEVALTFDKPYSLKEIRAMIPKNLKTNWYWIGTNSTSDPSWWQPSNLYGTSPDYLTQKEYVHKKEAEEAIKNLKEGEKLSDRLSEMKDVDGFLTNLKKYIKSRFGKSSYNNVTPSDDIKTYLKKFGKLDLSKKEDLDKLEFSGVILTGKSENFAQLEGKEWIYASSIGASIPNQPYYKLDKE